MAIRADFHFIWKKASGDMAISADINVVGSKGNNHRKAVARVQYMADVALTLEGANLCVGG